MKAQLKRLRLKHSVVVILLAGLVPVAFQNCAKANFSTPASSSAGGAGASGVTGYGLDPAYNNIDQPHTNPNSCYTFLHQTTLGVRLLFIVDQSGSNAGGAGTDPYKSVRGGSIQAFFDDYKAKPSFNWGFVSFAGVSASPFIMNAYAQPAFSAQSADMQSAISMFQSRNDSGNTPYQAALDSVIQAINNDSASPASTKYIVVFLSDGLPNPDIADSTLKNDVNAILATRPGQVTFNTVYYGPGDKTASERLRTMATTGGGYFLDTNRSATAKSFLISNVVNVPGSSCVP